MTESLSPNSFHPKFLEISLSDLKKFRVAFTQKPTDVIKSIDFSFNGSLVIYNTQNEIKLFELTGEKLKESSQLVQKYGSGICKFLRNDNIVHTLNANNMGSLDMTAQKYNFWYVGHSETVTSLDVFKSSTSSDIFASASLDNSVRIWSLKNQKYISIQEFSSHPMIACHPLKEKYAVAYRTSMNSHLVKIYDRRHEKGSVDEFEIDSNGIELTRMKYSNDGKFLMINTNDSLTIVLNAVDGSCADNLRGYLNEKRQPIEACFTPDTNFIMSGSENGQLHIWDVNKSEKVCILQNSIEGSCTKIEFNSKLMCFATTGDNFHLWIES